MTVPTSAVQERFDSPASYPFPTPPCVLHNAALAGGAVVNAAGAEPVSVIRQWQEGCGNRTVIHGSKVGSLLVTKVLSLRAPLPP